MSEDNTYQIDIGKELDQFLEERPAYFPSVTPEQRKEWISEIGRELNTVIHDHDIYYDCMPDGVDCRA